MLVPDWIDAGGGGNLAGDREHGWQWAEGRATAPAADNHLGRDVPWSVGDGSGHRQFGWIHTRHATPNIEAYASSPSVDVAVGLGGWTMCGERTSQPMDAHQLGVGIGGSRAAWLLECSDEPSVQ